MNEDVEVTHPESTDLLAYDLDEITSILKQDWQQGEDARYSLARHLYQVKHHELWQLATADVIEYKSYSDWLTNAVGIAENVTRTTGYALPTAFSAALEVSEQTGIPTRELWDKIGRTKLELIPVAPAEIRAVLIDRALNDAPRTELEELIAGARAEAGAEDEEDIQSTPPSDETPGELQSDEIARVSLKVVLGKDHFATIRDCATNEPMNGRPLSDIDQGAVEIPVGKGYVLQLKVVGDNDTVKNVVYRWEQA
jgi:hypothetical protein